MTRWTRPSGFSAWLGALAVSIALIAVRAEAQTNHKWEIEFHVGGGQVSDAPDGTANLPAGGPPFTTVVGATSRRTSSFYFGDGALLLSQVNTALGLAPAIVPLDPLFQRSLFERQSGPSYGFRVSRALTRRFGVEFSLDDQLGSLVLQPSVLAGIEATRASYITAFSALIGSGPFVAPTVTSESTIQRKAGHQILTTGALTVDLIASGRAIPYLTAGAGFASNVGGTPSASLQGNYRFQTVGRLPMNETDRVNLRTAIDDGAVGVFGGGLKFSVARRWGVRFDLRALVNKLAVVTLMDTRSQASSAMPSGAAASQSTPSMQFSNNAAVGPSSLSGQSLNGFRSFEARGWQTRMMVSGGLFVRF
jgi:hypothetical protein